MSKRTAAMAGLGQGGEGMGVGVGMGMGMGMMRGNPVESDEILWKKRLAELVSQVSSAEKMDGEAEELLLDIVDDFVETVTVAACKVAKHRGSPVLEETDVRFVLEQFWDIYIPATGGASFGSVPSTAASTSAAQSATGGAKGGVGKSAAVTHTKHQERLNFIRKLRK